MIQYFKAPMDKNGNTLQMIIDHDKKTIERGYCLYRFKDAIKVSSKKALRQLDETFIKAGYKHKITL